VIIHHKDVWILVVV